MDVRSLLRDRRAQLAAGGAALVGLVVLVRRRSSSAGASSAVGTAGGSGVSYGATVPGGASGVGSFSDGGAGFSADLGNFQTSLQGQLTEFTSQLNSTLGSLQSVPTSSGGNAGVPKNVIAPPASPAASAPAPANTAKNYGWFTSQSANNTVANVAKTYGITPEALVKLNPGLTVNSKIGVGSVVQVRNNAAAKPAATPAKK